MRMVFRRADVPAETILMVGGGGCGGMIVYGERWGIG